MSFKLKLIWVSCTIFVVVQFFFTGRLKFILLQFPEKGEINVKIETLKKVIQLLLNGERLPGLLMTIIRFVLPLQNHTIKKLLLIYWEIVPKVSGDGKLLQEMILVCDAYRKDLQHPNEFLRGSTLRFLCKLKEPELLEPLMPAIRACLEHRHSYVRRNAVLAIFTIFKNFEWLVPDGPELIANFLDTQQVKLWCYEIFFGYYNKFNF